MPALNPFILKGRLSACSEEVIKLTSLSPERNVFLTLKESWWARQSRDAAPSITSHRGRGCPAVAQRGRSPLLMGRALAPAAPSPHSFTHLLGWLFLSSPRAQSLMSNEIFLSARHDVFALWLSRQMGLFLIFIFFSTKLVYFCQQHEEGKALE